MPGEPIAAAQASSPNPFAILFSPQALASLTPAFQRIAELEPDLFEGDDAFHAEMEALSQPK